MLQDMAYLGQEPDDKFEVGVIIFPYYTRKMKNTNPHKSVSVFSRKLKFDLDYQITASYSRCEITKSKYIAIC